jgi:polyisoprenyl-phosphate glycosyltransferase
MAAELLSVVVPVHNEAPVLDELHRRLTAALEALGDYELVFVDDASTDASWEWLVGASTRDPRVRAFRLSRNFGHQVAISAGIELAEGDAVVTMDADLQHPPETIPALVAKWREGYDVVYAYRESRSGDGFGKRIATSSFYSLMARFARPEIPRQAGDFRLLSRRAVDVLVAMPERARFLRGMAAWIGFPQAGVPYHQEPRAGGTASYSAARLVRLAADGVFSFSTVPLRMVTVVGFVFSLFAGGYLIYTLYVRFFTDHSPTGWASVVVVVVLFGGVQLMSVGLLGQYVARIFDETKGRPLYLIADWAGTPQRGRAASAEAAPKESRTSVT